LILLDTNFAVGNLQLPVAHLNFSTHDVVKNSNNIYYAKIAKKTMSDTEHKPYTNLKL